MIHKTKIRKEVQTFRESIQKVVVMLSGKDIPVAERGGRAYVEYNADGTARMVCLPSIPDDATDGLMNAIRGFLDHEVAHLLFTDTKLAFRLLGEKDSPAFHLWNAVEDTFIERRMGEAFSGSKRNLINTQRHVIEKLLAPKAGEALKALASNPRDLFLKFFLMPALRAWAGQTPFIEFMEPYWPVIRTPVSKLEKAGIVSAVASLKSTEDCIKLAARISIALREDMEKPEDEKGSGESSEKEKEKNTKDKVGSEQPTETEKEPSNDEDNEAEENEENNEPASDNNTKEEDIKDKEEGEEKQDDDSQPNESESDENSQNSPDEVSESESSEDDQPEDDAPEPKSGEDDSTTPEDDGKQPSDELGSMSGSPDDELDFGDSAGEDDGDATSSDSEHESEESNEGSQEEHDSHGTGKGDIQLDKALKALEEADTAPEQGMEEALNKVMANELSGVSKGSYRPYQRCYDYLGPIDGAEAFLRKTHKSFGRITMHRSFPNWRIDEGGTKLFTRHIEPRLTDGSAATLAKDLERAIASKNKVQYIPGQRRGKVHSANLYRLSMNDDRVFRRKEDHKAVNACVQQVLDLSGSMGGEKIQLALACAYTIADALDRINVPNIITGFTTAGFDEAALEKHKRDYSRYEGLMLPTIKGWHERANTPSTRQRIGCLSDQFPLMNNIDGESIMALAQHFSARTEDKKIMLVLSDGIPAGVGYNLSDHLKDTAQALETSGMIELLAVGILTNAPKRFYKHHVLVNNVSELGATVVKKLSSLILG